MKVGGRRAGWGSRECSTGKPHEEAEEREGGGIAGVKLYLQGQTRKRGKHRGGVLGYHKQSRKKDGGED